MGAKMMRRVVFALLLVAGAMTVAVAHRRAPRQFERGVKYQHKKAQPTPGTCNSSANSGLERSYFGLYEKWSQHVLMLSDQSRTDGYYKGIMSNREEFDGKVVIDFGAGSGILSYFAAKAGAHKVYAIEASNIANLLEKNIARNGLSGTIQVVHDTGEKANLPEKADIVVSESFGHFAVFERMLESWLAVRDRFLKPGGRMYPAKARLFVGLSGEGAMYYHIRIGPDYLNTSATKKRELHGFDTTLYAEHMYETHVANRKQPAYYRLPKRQLVAVAAPYVQDYETMKIEELLEFTIPLDFSAIKNDKTIYELVCWFDFDFTGPGGTTTVHTGPKHAKTHWNQLHLIFKNEVNLKNGTSANGELKVAVNDKRGHEFFLTLTFSDGQHVEQQWSQKWPES